MSKTPNSSSSDKPKRLSEWVRRSDGRTSQEVEAMLASAEPAFNVLRNILEAKEKGKRPTLSDYDDPNWASRQAHQNGYNEALRLIKELLP